MGIAFILLLGFFMLAAYLLANKRNRYWIDRGYLSPPNYFPFGSVKGVGTKCTESEAMNVIYEHYKGKAPAIGTFFFFQPSIVVLDLELYKNILVRDFSSFSDRGMYYNKEDEPTSAK